MVATDTNLSAPRPLVLYHANCVDGFTAAWCAHEHYGDSADYLPMKNDGADFPVDKRPVLFLDCAPRREQLLDFQKRAESLIVLDHHVSNIKECEGIEGCTLDMTMSGAGLAARHFGRERLPNLRLVKYVQDQDLWKFELEHSRLVRNVLLAETFDWQSWTDMNDLLENRFPAAVEAGRILDKQKQKNNAYMAKKAIVMPLFAGYTNVPIVNMAHGDISQLLNDLADASDHGFAIAWHQCEDKKFKYSIRSTRDRFDCAAFAEKFFGGAGHKGASGWIAPLPPWEYSQTGSR